MMPRLSTMFGNFFSPGILRGVKSSLPFRYSIGSIETSSPVHSLKLPFTAVPSSLMPVITTSN
jgi:hypothetical protein